ncbi:Sec-independent protein translocase subunit TatA [Cellulomonas sp. RIT-PI-Y]|jgi:sec-independent protein translocase protein TatA|uniref:Sec-independent protein translocase subunit TatA n=1 Tax=Cellulomonas sp. RIT-PI-Y TaxID=3035297 RepID=UPI0021D9DA11|nr:Sec-independent protein translocase subunit TatA [Cellulomonas sp. RIT-PI-Y]
MNALKPWHIGVLLVVIILLFGAKRLPDLAKSVGQSLKIFKSEVKDLTDDDKTTAVQPTEPTVKPAGPVQQPGSTTYPPSGGSNTPS